MAKLSVRQLQVGEQIRRAISDIFVKEVFNENLSIVISKVIMSPDMSIAKVYVSLLENKEISMQYIKLVAPKIRYFLAKKISLRITPVLHFYECDMCDKMYKIMDLIKNDNE